MRRRLHKISKHIPSAFQASLDFAVPARRNFSLSVEHPAEGVAMRILFLALLACICMYLYFVGASVLNIMARKEASAQVSERATHIGGLEREYFTLAEDITLESGVRVGLAPVSETHYVYRPGAVGVAVSRNPGL